MFLWIPDSAVLLKARPHGARCGVSPWILHRTASLPEICMAGVLRGEKTGKYRYGRVCFCRHYTYFIELTRRIQSFFVICAGALSERRAWFPRRGGVCHFNILSACEESVSEKTGNLEGASRSWPECRCIRAAGGNRICFGKQILPSKFPVFSLTDSNRALYGL